MNRLRYILVAIFLTGCASQVPLPISQAPPGNLTLTVVQAGPEAFVGTTVRWGGVITRVENKATQTWVELVSRQLKKNGQPSIDGKSDGRFIASFQGFADPVVYETGRLLTIVGTIDTQTTRAIGEYAYSFPVVTVTSSYLWPLEAEPVHHEHPPPWWYYDPWPFYPWSYRPYRGPYHW